MVVQQNAGVSVGHERGIGAHDARLAITHT